MGELNKGERVLLVVAILIVFNGALWTIDGYVAGSFRAFPFGIMTLFGLFQIADLFDQTLTTMGLTILGIGSPFLVPDYTPSMLENWIRELLLGLHLSIVAIGLALVMAEQVFARLPKKVLDLIDPP